MSQDSEEFLKEHPRFNRVIINPDSHELSTSLDSATATANNQASRCRLVCKKFVKEFVKQAMSSPQGFLTRSQEGTGRGNYAVVGMAWFTDDLHRKHARISGGRAGSCVGGLFRYSGNSPVFVVYPEIWGGVETWLEHGVRVELLECSCGKKFRVNQGMWAGEMCLLCYEGERYFQDTGFYNAVGKVGLQRRVRKVS